MPEPHIKNFQRLLEHEELFSNAGAMEELLVCSRDLSWCNSIATDLNLLREFVKIVFENSKFEPILCKVIINIAYQVPTTRTGIASTLAQVRPKWTSSIKIPSEESFLISRLFFILSVDLEACKTLTNACLWMEKEILHATMSSFEPTSFKDSISAGKSLIDCLQVRYNQVNNSCIEPKKPCDEALKLLQSCPTTQDFHGIIGSIFHILSAKINDYAIDIDESILASALKVLLEYHSSPDYRSLILFFAYYKCKSNDDLRCKLRHLILTSPYNDPLIAKETWTELLSSTDFNLTLSTGQFLLCLCQDKVSRMVRHFGFGACAGFMYMKGLMQEECNPEELESSSDEEYFKQTPMEPEPVTQMMPQTEEEAQELEALMNKIQEFNSRVESQQ